MDVTDGATRRPIPLGLIGALGLILAAEAYVDRHELDVTPWGASAWGLSGAAAREDVRDCRVLCFGDSMVKVGVLPAVVSERTGLRAYNLAICGSSAPASYVVLRRALDAGARPSAVVVDFAPHLLIGGLRWFSRYWPELLGPRECLELAFAARDPKFLAETLLTGLSPTIRARGEIRGNLRAALRGGSESLREGNRAYRRHWRANLGAQPTAKSPFDGAVDARQHELYSTGAWWCDPINRAYIGHFLDLAARHRIAVYWLLPPFAPAIQARRDATRAEAGYLRFVRRIQQDHPSLTVVDARHSGYDAARFVDPGHLNDQGAITLSADLADLLARGPGRGRDAARWVALPPYRPRATAARLVTLDQYGVALRFEEARRLR